ncbi:MAG: enoyl-CoA hydratase-related protein [Acidobacteriota bacterium]
MNDAVETVRTVIDGRVATVWLDRPPLNILDLATTAALDAAFEALTERDGLRLVVVRGAGDRAFSAGVAIEDHAPATIRPMLDGFHGALRRLVGLDMPVVAAVDGHCLGGGMELAATCDFVLATEGSTFGQPEVLVGCFPPVAAALYPSLVAPGVAFDLVLSGRTIDAREAERLGFVTRIVADGDLDAGLDQLISELARSSAAVLRHTKRALVLGDPRRERFERALAEAERLYLDDLASTHDLREGVDAFLEKRPPAWRHA